MVASSGERPLSRPRAGRGPRGASGRRRGVSLLAVCACLALAACGSSSKPSSSTSSSASRRPSSSSTSAQSATPHPGGSITVLESAGFAGDWPTGLDPATNVNGAADQNMMDSIFGELWELQGNSKLTPDLATGTRSPTAARRSRSRCARASSSPTARRSTPRRSSSTGSATWRPRARASRRTSWSSRSPRRARPPSWSTSPPPTARSSTSSRTPTSPGSPRRRRSRRWASRRSSSSRWARARSRSTRTRSTTRWCSRRTPSYWQRGHPYLDQLTFKTTASDETALEAMQAGQGNAYEGMSSPQLVNRSSRSSPSPGAVDVAV